MIKPAQLALEVVLIVAALLVLRVVPGTRRHRFVLGFTALTLLLNLLEDYLGAWSLYVSYAESAGLSRAGMHALIMFDVVKWGVLAYVLSRLAISLADAGIAPGFALLRSDRQMRSALLTGLVTALGATAVIYVLILAEYHVGFIGGLPWQHPLPGPLRFWGGFRNLTGEEILARLGAQSVLLYALRNNRYKSILAITLSAFYFELWHNGIKQIYFLNFTASCLFGWAYQKRGYECAAVAHCVADWIFLLILPLVLS